MKCALRVLLITLSMVLSASIVAIPFPLMAKTSQPGDILQPRIYSSGTTPENLDDFSLAGAYPKKGNPKLDSALNILIDNSVSSFSGGVDSGQSSTGEPTVRVVVESNPGSETEAANASSEAGMVEALYHGLVQVNLPVSRLSGLASNESIRFIRLPYQATPAEISEGVSLVNAATWQTAGYRGSGVKIGIIDPGFSGYETLQTLGELPANITVSWSTPGGEGTSVHGAACAEILYDIAPEATYYFAKSGTDVEFGVAVDWMIAHGVDIISHSAGWSGLGPGNGTGLIDQIVDKAYNAGIFWSQAAGNHGKRHWSVSFVNTDGDSWLDFAPGDEGNTINVVAGEQINAVLNWNDTWGASANNYDLVLFDNAGNIVSRSANEQNGNDNPYESLSYTATYSGTYALAIAKYLNPAVRNFNLYTFGQDLQYEVAAGSLSVPADSTHVTTVGAVPWGSPTTIETFSSEGPNASGVVKPDIVAPDGVSTVTYGTADFYGTSASTPCVAGTAALVKEAYPSYTNIQIKSYLESQAVGLGAPGKDNIFGSGRLFLGTPPGKIDFTSGAQIITAGAVSAAITVQTQDADGRPLTVGSNTHINLTSNSPTGRFDTSEGGLFSSAAIQVIIPVGNDSASFYYKDTTSGTPAITAASAGMATGTQIETINAGPATKIRVETAANGTGTIAGARNLVAGSTLTVYGVTRDEYNNYVGNPAETSWSLVKTGGVADTDLSAASGASVALTAHLAGSAIIHAENAGLTPGDSGSIIVTKGAFDHLHINAQPASTLSVDSVFDTVAVVMASDAGGNPISGLRIVADRDPATGTGVLRGTLAVTTNTSGLATFNSLAYDKTDAFRVRFTSGAKAVISEPVGPLPAGAVKSLSFAATPLAGASVDADFSTQPAILVKDQLNNPVGGVNVVASIGAGTPTALRGVTTVASAAGTGLASFPDLGYNKSGQAFTLRFSAGSLFLNSASLGPLAAGAATQIRVETAANGSGAVVGARTLLAGSTLVVYGVTRDQYSNFLGNPTNTSWSLTDETGSVVDTDLSAASGASVTLNAHLIGSGVIHAENGALISVDSGTITINAGPPAAISMATPPAVGASVDDNFSAQPVILVTDSGHNPVGGITVTASRATGSGTLRGTLTAVSGVDGLAAFTNLGYNKSGEEFTLHFAAKGLTANSDRLGPISPGLAVAIVVESAPDGSGTPIAKRSLNIGTSLTVYGISRDQHKNYLDNPSGTVWSLSAKTGGVVDGDLVASEDGKSAIMSGHQKGTAIVHASNAALTAGDSGLISVGASTGGGGGGGGGGVTSYKVTLSGLNSPAMVYVNASGVVSAVSRATSSDGILTLNIPAATRMLTKENSAVTTLSAEVLASPPACPSGTALVMAYNLGPEGAIFNPALTITLTYDPAELPKDVAEKDLYIARYDGVQWQTLESTVDEAANTVSAKITGFSRYALLGKVTAPPVPVPSPMPVPSPLPSPSPSPTPAVTLAPSLQSISTPTVAPAPSVEATPVPAQVAVAAPSPAPASTSEDSPAAPIKWPLIIGIVVVVAAFLAGSILVFKRRRA
jgi:hypothetical protein